MHYKDQTVNAVYGNHYYLFQEHYETQKHCGENAELREVVWVN
jgi:hypothetical protein